MGSRGILDLEGELLAGRVLPRDTAEQLMTVPEGHPQTEALFRLAERVRRAVHGNRVELCAIQNARSGRCTEDCRFCAQSGHYRTGSPEYPLLGSAEILAEAARTQSQGIHRFSLVISGHRVEPALFRQLLERFSLLRQRTGLQLCASLGAIGPEQAEALRAAGVTRYHHNLETSEAYYPRICTTHRYQERLDTLAACRQAGLELCSGGIIGMGESPTDRLDLAYTLRREGVRSIPLNCLQAVPGTPLAGMPPLTPFEILRTGAVFRLINPFAVVRYAGGRGLLGDAFVQGCRAGISGLMTGDLLTTAGQGVRQDLEALAAAGFTPELLP